MDEEAKSRVAPRVGAADAELEASRSTKDMLGRATLVSAAKRNGCAVPAPCAVKRNGLGESAGVVLLPDITDETDCDVN